MERFTVILLDYLDPRAIQKGLDSLQSAHPNIDSIILLQNTPPTTTHQHVQTLTTSPEDWSKTLNQTIADIKSESILFLQQTEYLSPHIHLSDLQLRQDFSIITQSSQYKGISLEVPVVIRTSLLQKCPFPSTAELPFPDALLPFWLSRQSRTQIKRKNKLVRCLREQRTKEAMEKFQFMGKYQLEDVQIDSPSLAIFMSSFNMDTYIEAALGSCIHQNVQADEIFVMDDGSTDNTSEKINKWRDEPGLQIFSKQNEGKARALNELLPQITADFVLELDADDWLDPDAVTVIKERLTTLPEDVAVLYGNLRQWKQLEEKVSYKYIARGRKVNGREDLLNYRFPLGPRIYRTSALRAIGGFPIVPFQKGKLYEDVSVLERLIRDYRFQYKNFTVYNVRKHSESITKKNATHWDEFLKSLKER